MLHDVGSLNVDIWKMNPFSSAPSGLILSLHRKLKCERKKNGDLEGFHVWMSGRKLIMNVINHECHSFKLITFNPSHL